MAPYVNRSPEEFKLLDDSSAAFVSATKGRHGF